MNAATVSIVFALWSRLKFIPGTRRAAQFSWKCTMSPERSTAPVFGSRTTSTWWPGVCPGADLITTEPSPNTSWSPFSFTTLLERSFA
jgi:hypothetical protein